MTSTYRPQFPAKETVCILYITENTCWILFITMIKGKSNQTNFLKKEKTKEHNFFPPGKVSVTLAVLELAM